MNMNEEDYLMVLWDKREILLLYVQIKTFVYSFYLL